MITRAPRTPRKFPGENRVLVTVKSHAHYAVSHTDGSPIYYDVAEPPAGSVPPIATAVMCDGIGCDGYVWKYLRRDLLPTYRLVHWHYRGHGRTPMPRDRRRVGIAALASDLECVLDDAGIERAVLLGHSMGVQVALEAYRRYPRRIEALVLICGAPENPLRTFRGTARFEALLPAMRRTVRRAPWLFNRISRAFLPTRLAYEVATLVEANGALLDPGDFMPYLEGISRIDVGLFLDMLDEACRHSAVDLLAHIDVPVLVIAGTTDSFTPPEQSARMHEAIPEAEMLMIEQGSHTAPIERPEEVNLAVSDFLRRRLGRTMDD